MGPSQLVCRLFLERDVCRRLMGYTEAGRGSPKITLGVLRLARAIPAFGSKRASRMLLGQPTKSRGRIRSLPGRIVCPCQFIQHTVRRMIGPIFGQKQFKRLDRLSLAT